METKKTAVFAIAWTNEKHRSIERVTSLVEAALLQLGGLAQFVPPRSTVLLKPNQTVYYSAEEGCTTDPTVIGALIRLCKKAGAARVQVAESSGVFFLERLHAHHRHGRRGRTRRRGTDRPGQ